MSFVNPFLKVFFKILIYNSKARVFSLGECFFSVFLDLEIRKYQKNFYRID